MKPKIALLTGATGGLGCALATLLSNKGIYQILAGRDHEKLKSLSLPNSKTLLADLSQPQLIIDTIWKEKPDLIINNAGFGLYGETTSLSTKEQLTLFEVNAKAVMEITIESAKMLLQEQKKGIILNVSSMAGEMPTPMMSAYGASKAFVTHFSKSMDFECRSKGIRILVSCPGQFSSSFAAKASKNPYLSHSGISFSKEKLAERIWRQILKEKGIDIYDFRYQFFHVLTKYFLPESLIAHLISKNIQKRIVK